MCLDESVPVRNEVALLAARHGPSHISMALVEEGIDRARMGVASRGILLTDARRLITYHEAGHALVSRALPEAIERRPCNSTT